MMALAALYKSKHSVTHAVLFNKVKTNPTIGRRMRVDVPRAPLALHEPSMSYTALKVSHAGSIHSLRNTPRSTQSSETSLRSSCTAGCLVVVVLPADLLVTLVRLDGLNTGSGSGP